MWIVDPQFEFEARCGATSAGGRQIARLGHLLMRLEAVFEAERDRLALWLVVTFGLGILLYFAGATEPPLWLGLLAAGGLALLVFLARRRGRLLQILTCGLLAAALGFLASEIRTRMVAAPVLAAPMGPVEVEGRLLSADAGGRGGLKALIAVRRIEGLAAGATPTRLRVSVRMAAPAFQPGMAIKLTAMLRPPAGPAAPGAYDFARRAYFERIGAVGYALSTPEILPGPPQGGFESAVERIRKGLAERIAARLDSATAGVAVALVTGLRSDIPEAAEADLRNSGLYHLISISGVHMSALALGLFFGLRFLLALSAPLALRHPIKKWAAAATIAGTFVYLIFTGASVPTFRSFVMVALVFLAVIADRRALTMRNVAIAAGLILVVAPENVLDASFQMSFAATVALIAAYEAWDLRQRPGQGRLIAYGLGLVLTGLVAGFAIAPFLAFHFQTATPLSLFANLGAIPVTDLIIMPAAFLIYVLAPFGLDGAAIMVLGWGCDLLLWVAGFMAHLPGAVRSIPAGPSLALLLITAGGLWLALWQRSWRVFGVLPIAAGLALWALARGPDLLIDRRAEIIALRDASGRLALIRGRAGSFEAETWLRRDGVEPNAMRRRAEALRCDAQGCVAPLRAGGTVAVSDDPGSLADDCRRARVVISTGAVRAPCSGPALVIDRRMLAGLGTVAVYLHDGPIGPGNGPGGNGPGGNAPGYEIRPANPQKNRRPWSPRPEQRPRPPRPDGAAGEARVSTAE